MERDALGETQEEPPGPHLPSAFAYPSIETIMAPRDKEVLTISQQKERVIAALLLATWYTKTGKLSLKYSIDELADLYRTDLEEAAEKSKVILLALKREFAVSEPKFGVDEPVFLKVGIGEKDWTKAQCEEIWHKEFAAIFDSLSIHDAADRYEYLFSGLGYETLRLCVVVYERDWNEAFAYHEFLHIKFKGLTNTFFDEMVTETLAYAKCGYVDLTTYSLKKYEELYDLRINVDYYHWLEHFLQLCHMHPELFPYLRTLYEQGDGSDTGLDHVATIIGKEEYKRLLAADPSK